MDSNTAAERLRRATPLRDLLAISPSLARLTREASHLHVVEQALRAQMRTLAGVPFHLAAADAEGVVLVTDSAEWAMRLKLCSTQIQSAYSALISASARGRSGRPAVRIVTRPGNAKTPRASRRAPAHQNPPSAEARAALAALARDLASIAEGVSTESVAEVGARRRLSAALARLAGTDSGT